MNRLKVVKTCYFVFVFLIIVRLWYWQIIRSDFLEAKAEGQHVFTQTVVAPRGNILFSDGAVLASTQPVFSLFAQPKIIADKTEVEDKLASVLWSTEPHPGSIEASEKDAEVLQIKSDLDKKLNQDLYWVSLGWRVTYDIKQQIDKLGISGIGFDQNYIRFYPEGSSSAHLLGFVGSDIYGNPTGYFGLEGFYNGQLRGRDGELTQEKDAQGLPILIGKYLSRNPEPGKTIRLNIDQTVQHIVEEKLKSGMEKYGAKEASAVVMDPETGAIVAMASYPNYDPSHVMDFPNASFKNPIIADEYEPGSTFKILVMAAAFNEHLLTPETVCDACNGPVQIDNYTIRTWNNKYFPDSSMTDVLVHSDNVGMVFVAHKLGLDRMYSYLQDFGLGRSTGVDLQDELAPDLRPREDWRPIDLDTASFGQGISFTALQMVKAISAIANGGKMMEPHVASAIIGESGNTQRINPRVAGTPISPETAKIVTDIMVQAVDKGEAQYYKRLYVPNFKIAGKTGTAQIPVAGHYDPTKTIASFVGFAPADNPKFLMLVRFNQPTSSIYGADTAAPTFFQVAKELFTYYGIAPD